MPAIRDFTTNFTNVSTGTTIVIDTPVYQENDLLLAVLSADTGTGTWSSSGWTVLFAQTNTAQLAVLYRIATGSEPTTYTFTRSASESFNGGVFSIRDVNITHPFGNPAVYTVSNQTASSRFQMNTITTTVANSLVFYCMSHSTQNGSPTFVEGPVNFLYTVQGISESSGTGWGFQASTGTTPDVFCATPVTGAGVKATIQIAPPSGGANVIPPYGVNTGGTYVDPIDGTNAYNSNTAFAATATTHFGSSLGGITLANGSVSAGADYGINPTHNVGQLTTSAANNWSGATLVLASANFIDVTGKNVLVHTGPSTPLQYQRLKSSASGMGIAFGMRSNSSNYKVWHVHGAGTSFVHNRDVPLIINSEYESTGMIQNTGTFDPSSVQVFGFFVASQATTSLYQFYSLWVLDTIIIGGGTPSEPVGIDGITSVIQGHEHRGALIQGANQMLLLMPVQFGNGGTNPIYLDLNSTAIEFPEIYNRSNKKVNYCSAPNVAGITYYAGSGDTIKHRNSVISSKSKYHWQFHSSSSTSATYDFSGLSVIGAGTVSLINNLSISGVTWSSCDEFNSAGAYLDECFIENTTGASALTVSSTTNMSRITNCTFSENNDGDLGHSIKLTAIGTYSFDNITFEKGGPAERSFNTGTDVNSSTDIVSLDSIHGYSSGDAVYYQKQGGSANMGLTDGTLYYINAQSSNTLSFHNSKANAIADISRIDLTSSGSETHYIYSAKADVFNNSGGAVTINVINGGNTPTIRNSNGSSTIVNNAVSLIVKVVNTSNDPIQDAQVAIFKTSDDSQLMNTTTNTVGVATATFNFTEDTSVYVRIRKSSVGSTRYIPINTTGTITSSGFSITVTLIQDNTANT